MDGWMDVGVWFACKSSLSALHLPPPLTQHRIPAAEWAQLLTPAGNQTLRKTELDGEAPALCLLQLVYGSLTAFPNMQFQSDHSSIVKARAPD